MAQVTVAEESFCDIRYDRLAAAAGLADADHARGKMLRLWRQCTIEQTYSLTADDVRNVLGDRGVDALIASRLGEMVGEMVRIRGTNGRIEWLGTLRDNGKFGKRGGRPKSKPTRVLKSKPTRVLRTKPTRVRKTDDLETPIAIAIATATADPETDLAVAAPRNGSASPCTEPEGSSAAVAADPCAGCSRDGLKLADYLRRELLKSKPDHRIGRGQHASTRWDTSKTRAQWAKALDAMVRIDGRDWRRSAELVHFVCERQTGDVRFVVESPKALREKWDRLDVAERRARASPASNGGNATELERPLKRWTARPRPSLPTADAATPEPETPSEPQIALPSLQPTENP